MPDPHEMSLERSPQVLEIPPLRPGPGMIVQLQAPPPARFALCGNCGRKIPVTADPAENHHRAQRHRDECGKRTEAEDELRDLRSEFARQELAREQARKVKPSRAWRWRFWNHQ